MSHLLRLFFLLRESVRLWSLLPALCGQILGLSSLMRDVK